MTDSRIRRGWLEVLGVFAAIVCIGALVVPLPFGRDWSGGLQFYLIVPFQLGVSLFVFSALFIVRKYTGFAVGLISVIGLSALASYLMLVLAGIHASYGSGP